jgi:hypothetical protein
MALTNLNFSLFDINIQCLMRQDVQLLNESFKNGFYFFIFFIFYCTLFYFIIIIYMPRYPSNKSPNFTQDIENTQSGSYIIPRKLYANVLVIVLIETNESLDAKSK